MESKECFICGNFSKEDVCKNCKDKESIYLMGTKEDGLHLCYWKPKGKCDTCGSKTDPDDHCDNCKIELCSDCQIDDDRHFLGCEGCKETWCCTTSYHYKCTEHWPWCPFEGK